MHFFQRRVLFLNFSYFLALKSSDYAKNDGPWQAPKAASRGGFCLEIDNESIFDILSITLKIRLLADLKWRKRNYEEIIISFYLSILW